MIDDRIESYKKYGREISRRESEDFFNFPKYKPYYYAIYKDDRGNIYVLKKEEESLEYDLFNGDGYYLYKVKIPQVPSSPCRIKNGHIYTVKYEQETGYPKVKRNKIKNWEQLKEYTPPS